MYVCGIRHAAKYENSLFAVTGNETLITKSTGEVREFVVSICDRSKVSAFITNNHYSGNINGLTIDYCFKLEDTAGKLIGAMIYGKIAMANVWRKYASEESDLIELKRLCCIDDTPKNTESYFIGKTLKWLKKNTKIKTVISYADSTFGHSGIIYKATNFKYEGTTTPGKTIVYNGLRYHDKTIRTKYNGIKKPFALKIEEELKNGNAKYEASLPKHIFTYKLR